MREIKFRAIHKLTKKKWDEEELVFHSGEWYENWRAFEDGVPLNLKQCAVMQYTGLTDKDGIEIYEGDILEITDLWRRYRVVVNFGEYLQDGSGGEYTGSKCVGFYAEALHKDALDEDEFEVVREEMYTSSILEYEDIKILGNVYENPELLEAQT